jgi:hypothetical protein
VDRGTVRRYVATGSFPEHASPVHKRGRGSRICRRTDVCLL